MAIILKSEKEIATMRQAGRIVGEILEVLSAKVAPGMKTKELDDIAGTDAEAVKKTVISINNFRIKTSEIENDCWDLTDMISCLECV